MTLIEPGMPRRVLRRAWAYGVHTDCLVSGNLCDSCHAAVMKAFDEFYGGSASEAEVIAEVVNDFHQDMIEDQQKGLR